MNNNITTYYIPNNPNVDKGLIYTLYLNNNKNLDLSSIINKDNITVNTILNQKTKENINTYNKIPELLKKLSQNLDAYIIKEKELITELTNQCNEFIALRKEDKFE